MAKQAQEHTPVAERARNLLEGRGDAMVVRKRLFPDPPSQENSKRQKVGKEGESDGIISGLLKKIDDLEASVKTHQGEVKALQAALAKSEAARSKLQSENDRLNAVKSSLRAEHFETSPSAVNIMTTMPSYGHIKKLSEVYMGVSGGATSREYAAEEVGSVPRGAVGRGPSLDPINRLFLVLIWLRQGLSEPFLAILFGISQPTVSRYIRSTLPALSAFYRKLYPFPDLRTITQHAPAHFKKVIGTDVSWIIDSFEFNIQVTSNKAVQALTWSTHYKANMGKVLVAVTPDGFIWVSNVFGGRITDHELVKVSGFLDLLERGMHIVMDRGFTKIVFELLRRGCLGIAPSRLRKRSQFFEEEMSANTDTSNLRIHIERAIGMMTEFNILKIPMNVSTFDLVDHIFEVIRGLCNHRTPMTVRKDLR